MLILNVNIIVDAYTTEVTLYLIMSRSFMIVGGWGGGLIHVIKDFFVLISKIEYLSVERDV